jgi:hypothetical protein
MHAPAHMLTDRFGATPGLHRRDTGTTSGLHGKYKTQPGFALQSPVSDNHGRNVPFSAIQRRSMSMKDFQPPLANGDNVNPAMTDFQTAHARSFHGAVRRPIFVAVSPLLMAESQVGCVCEPTDLAPIRANRSLPSPPPSMDIGGRGCWSNFDHPLYHIADPLYHIADPLTHMPTLCSHGKWLRGCSIIEHLVNPFPESDLRRVMGGR